jgi:hypothetical protein
MKPLISEKRRGCGEIIILFSFLHPPLSRSFAAIDVKTKPYLSNREIGHNGQSMATARLKVIFQAYSR